MKLAVDFCLIGCLVLDAGSGLAGPGGRDGRIDLPRRLDGFTPRGDDLGPASGVLSLASQGPTYFGGTAWAADSSRWEAIQDSMWTFDTGVGSHFQHGAPFVNPHKGAGLHALMEGWIGIDNTYDGDNPYFRRLGAGSFSGTPCVGSAAGLGGNWSVWCGVTESEANALCYAAGRGYGNSWNLSIQKSFAYPAPGPVLLEYDYVNQTEPGFDYTYVLVETSAVAAPVEVAVYQGSVSGHASWNLLPGIQLRSAPGTITVRFTVDSDGAYSDEDALYTTSCGAFAVDDIKLSGAVVSGPDGFESGSDGWALYLPPGPGGDWSNLVDVSDLPPLIASCGCALYDTVLVFEDLTVSGHGPSQDNLAASPWIDLAAAGEMGRPVKFVELDCYAEMPLHNYVFMQVVAQWYPSPCPNTGLLIMSPFTSGGFVYYFGGAPFCTKPGGPPLQLDFSDVIDVGAEQVRVAVGAVSFCRFFNDCSGVSNGSPWVDNVRFGVSGVGGAPAVSATTVDLPFDSFPQNGTLRLDAPGRVDCNHIQGDPSPVTGSALGDTLVVRGGTGGAEVYVQFAVDPGPGVSLPAFTAWLTSHQLEGTWRGQTWYSARMDSAEVGGNRRKAQWMTTYHELDPNFNGNDKSLDPGDPDPYGHITRLANDIFPDDMFTPGTRLNLFYKARYTGSGEPYTGVWYTEPDTSGGVMFEMEVLPSSAASDSTWNCVLYVDHFDGRGAQPVIEAGLAAALPGASGNFEQTRWDRYDVRAPDSEQLSFGRPLECQNGATVTQAMAYSTILWDCGNLNDFNLSEHDAGVLNPWLSLSGEGLGVRNLYLSGDGVAASIEAGYETAPAAVTLLEDWMGVIFQCGTVRSAGCPISVFLEDTTSCLGVDPVLGHFTGNSGPGTTVLLGNACPLLRSFDLLSPGIPNSGNAQGNEAYVSPLKGTMNYCSVSTRALGTPEYKTVIDGGSVAYRRDASNCAGTGAVADRLQSVLGWFGVSARCSDPSAALDAPPPEPERPRTAMLDPVSPNPLPASAPAGIVFHLPAPRPVRAGIYDASGRLVRTLFDGPAPAGPTRLAWDGDDDAGRRTASGVYFVRIQVAQTREELTQKLIVLGR